MSVPILVKNQGPISLKYLIKQNNISVFTKIWAASSRLGAITKALGLLSLLINPSSVSSFNWDTIGAA